MRNPYIRAVILSVLATGIVLGAALPAWADHTGFSKREYQVGEDAAYVELTVETSCCPLGSGQIDYYTSNLSAIAGDDYQQTSGTLTFPAEYTIRVPIIDDELFEGEEQFEVRLTNYRGTFINNMGRTTVAVVRIVDNDPHPASNAASPERKSQPTTLVASSGTSQSQPAGRSSGTTGDAMEVSHPTSEKILSDDGVATPNEIVSVERSDHPPSTTQPNPKSPIVPLIALGILLGLTSIGLLVARKRNGPQTERR